MILFLQLSRLGVFYTPLALDKIVRFIITSNLQKQDSLMCAGLGAIYIWV